MKHYLKSTVCAIMSVAILMMSGCSSDDGPKGPKVDYSQLRIGHMDLSGAVSIGLKDKNGSSRAIDGEYLSAGLYKVDAQGNISAVGVYFTTDNQGNRLEHEEVLRVVPDELHNLTDNYMLVRDCEYYDCDGDVVNDHYEGEEGEYYVQQAVPYKNLLVRKSDGKIWCVDNIFELLYDYWYHRLIGNFNEDAAGALYYRKGDGLVYKFNLQEDSSSLEQLTNTSETMWLFHVAYNGVIWSHGDHYIDGRGLMFEWPHSGFQQFTGDYLLDDIGGKLERTIPGGAFRDLWGSEFYTDSIRIKPSGCASYPIEFQYKPYLMIVPTRLCFLQDNGDKMPESKFRQKEALREAKWPTASIYAIDLGSSPGSAKIADAPMIQLFGVPEDALVYDSVHRVYSFYHGDGYVLTIGTGNWVTKIDLVNHTWEWMKKLDVKFDLYGSWTYSGKVWRIDTSHDHFGAYWFDLTSFEEGFVNFNNLPSFFDERDYDYSNGKMIYSEQDPATGNHVKVVIDITTGAAITDEQAPEYLFETIINLN